MSWKLLVVVDVDKIVIYSNYAVGNFSIYCPESLTGMDRLNLRKTFWNISFDRHVVAKDLKNHLMESQVLCSLPVLDEDRNAAKGILLLVDEGTLSVSTTSFAYVLFSAVHPTNEWLSAKEMTKIEEVYVGKDFLN